MEEPPKAERVKAPPAAEAVELKEPPRPERVKAPPKEAKARRGPKNGKKPAPEAKPKGKKSIHPNYGPAKIVCGCGNVIETYSTRKRMVVAVCSNCHPFYTGSQRFIDATGRVERFRKKFGLTTGKKPEL